MLSRSIDHAKTLQSQSDTHRRREHMGDRSWSFLTGDRRLDTRRCRRSRDGSVGLEVESARGSTLPVRSAPQELDSACETHRIIEGYQSAEDLRARVPETG